MSETVIDSGRLIPITLAKEEAEAECERLGVDYAHYETPQEGLACETEEYADIEGLGFCRVENFKTVDANEDWCELTKNEDGSYNFRTQYYNGGAHWVELVEWAVKKENYDA